MGLVDKLIDNVVFLDTSPLIYYIEGHSDYQKELTDVFQANDRNEFRFITSTLTLLEVLVHPMRMKKQGLAGQYEKILTSSETIEIVELNARIAKRSAQIRAEHHLKTPDAIQMATALENNAGVFLTNDKDLTKIGGIEVITFSK